MKKLLFITYILLLLSCTNKHNPRFPIPSKPDIDGVVQAIILQDSLLIQNIPLSIDLRKLKIYHAKTKLPPPPHLHVVDIKHLLPSSYYKQGFFNRKDSTYLIFQNNVLKSYILNKNSFGKLKFTTTAEQEKQGSTYEFAHYFDMSIPFFSLDQKKAYVQLDRICPRCGAGYIIILEKKNGNWRITNRTMTWIN